MRQSAIVRDILSLSLDAVAVTFQNPADPIAKFVTVTDAFCELFGYDENDVIGRPASICYYAAIWETYYNQIAPVVAAGEKTFTTELQCLTYDGTSFWASISLLVVDDPASDGFFLRLTYRDVSALKAREAAAEEALSERGAWLDQRKTMTKELRSSQLRLESAMNAYPEPYVIFDKDYRLVTCNTAYLASMSTDPDKIYPGMHCRDILKLAIEAGFIDQSHEAVLEDMLSTSPLNYQVEDIELSGDRHHRILRTKTSSGDWMVVRVNTTELVRESRALRDSQERLVSAINAFPDSFAIYDANDKLVTWNPAFVSTITDDPAEIFVGMDLKDILKIAVTNGHVPAAKGREAEWLGNYSLYKAGSEELEFDGDQHFKVVRSEGENGECVVMRLNVTDVVRQRRAIETYAKQLESANTEIEYKAVHDDLTGLGNRRYLTQKFAEFSALRKEKGGELATLHIDLDRFKQINDTMGHAAGDHVLLDVADRIKAHVGNDDVIARIGGDEFVILLMLTDKPMWPECLANALLKALAKPSLYNGRECRFAASIGIARTPLTVEADLLVNSDVALYRAKRSGRGQVAIFDHDDLNEMKRIKFLADDIMRALEEGEFIPYYQPQVDAHSGRIVGLEVLARWDHPENGIMTPDRFLDVATDLNVVADIDRLIAETAIAECEVRFAKIGYFPRLSFNVSANRLQIGNLDSIRKLAQSYSGKIVFELLETVFLEEADDGFLMLLDEIRDIGISLEIDDFGSGRASIVALQRISPDQLKIDRRLIAPISYRNNATQLVKSIIEIGHSLGIGVIAEGVETLEQAQIVADLGATTLQGFYFSKPLNVKSLMEYLDRAPFEILGSSKCGQRYAFEGGDVHHSKP